MSKASPHANESAATDLEKNLYGGTLVYMVHRLLDFREAEFTAVANMCGVPAPDLVMQTLPGDSNMSPFRVAQGIARNKCSQICSRTILTKGLFEFWGSGRNMAELKQSISRCPDHLKTKWFGADVSFRYVIEGFGVSIPEVPDKRDMMDAITEVCPFAGPVSLKSPDIKLWVFVVDAGGNAGLPEEIPYRLVAARELACSDARSSTQPFTLTKRRYLGPTSMDHELSFLMCNLGHVRKNSIVYDPFAGTGSILVAAAAWGARVLGTDIDIRVIRDGKPDKGGRPCCVYSNFKDYKLDDPVGLLRADVANPPWRAGVEGIVDVILCDPPYGVRAGGRKMAPQSPDDKPLPTQAGYVPATKPYALLECLVDLLETAAKLLIVGGRMCYWMPDFIEYEPEPDKAKGTMEGPTDDSSTDQQARIGKEVGSLSQATGEVTEACGRTVGSIHRDPCMASRGATIIAHPCLEIVDNGIQCLTTSIMRRLITVAKLKPFDAAESAAWRERLKDRKLPIETIHDVAFQTKERGGRRSNKLKFRGKTQ
eukprot:jgi/Ulvmu1/9778/UM056_0018.1